MMATHVYNPRISDHEHNLCSGMSFGWLTMQMVYDEASWVPDEPNDASLQSDMRFFRSLIVGLIAVEVAVLIVILLWW